ncbi:glycosyltransferase family 2 protein [Apibacter adventoris]|uniref:glycosyltransferase family 2 protein n=1 Tax=Apibacter adventoris TaxID=1679466 RepID=UPI000CF6D651|nr:glycosyltransferase family 2 protein [Apibacter adventoris]PQL92484.1 hypothetical protein C4S76_10425 [Apibacter adventoris]
MNKSISLVLATYNGEKYILEQLDSIMNQELLPNEIIIIDDCSTDRTYSILESYNFKEIKVQIIKNEKNVGPITNFKRGINLATSDFIALCDQDDIWLPNKLKLSLNAILKLDFNNIPCAIFTDLRLIDEHNKLIANSLHSKWNIDPSKFDFFLILTSNVVTGCTLLFNKLMQSEIQSMPEDILMHDYWIALIGYSIGQIKYVKQETVLYRSHNDSVTSKKQSSFIMKMRDFREVNQKQYEQLRKFMKQYKFCLRIEDREIVTKYLKMRKKNYIEQRIIIKFWKWGIKLV